MDTNYFNKEIDVDLGAPGAGPVDADSIRRRCLRVPTQVRVRDGARTSGYDATDFRAGWRTAAALAADDLGDATTDAVTVIVRNEPGFGGPRTSITTLMVRGSIVERVLDWLGCLRATEAERRFLEQVADRTVAQWAR
jgi:hypothetical protein